MLEVVQASLPMDGHAWRVEWYGTLRPNPASPLEHQIAITFRRMASKGVRREPPVLLEVDVGVGVLCNLPIGSIWCDGRMVGYADFDSIDCMLELDAAHELPIPLVRPDADELGPLRFGSLSLPECAARQRAVLVPIARSAERGQVLIPTAEVARAWYLRDSVLTLCLLSGPIGMVLHKLHDPAHTKNVEGVLHLALQPRIHVGAVPTIAMLVCKPFARRSVASLYDSIVEDRLVGRSPYLTAEAPLKYAARIRGRGEWHQIAGRRIFCAYWLTGVQIPSLPAIEWFRVGESSEDVERERRDGLVPCSQPVREILRILHTDRPSRAGSILSLLGRGAEVLNAPDVARRPVPKRGEGTITERGKVNWVDSPCTSSNEASSGEGIDWGPGMPSARYVTLLTDSDVESRRNLLPAGFQEMTEVALKISEDVEMTVRSSGGVFTVGDVSGFQRTVMEPALAWCLIEGRPRQALVIEIEFAGRYFYLFEIERRVEDEEVAACLIGRHDAGRCSEPDIDRILGRCADYRGSWTGIRPPFWYRTLAHKFKHAGTFSTRICQLVREHPGIHPEQATVAAAGAAPEPENAGSCLGA